MVVRRWLLHVVALATVTAACTSVAPSGVANTKYDVVPREAQETDLLNGYDLLHRLGLRVQLTKSTRIAKPRFRVPDFTGRTAAAAVDWAGRHRMFWAIPTLPPLPASSARHLLDAYRVVGQQPTPGGTIVQGVKTGHAYRPTPLTLRVVVR